MSSQNCTLFIFSQKIEIANGARLQLCIFSGADSNSHAVAYVLDNNLYYLPSSTAQPIQITDTGIVGELYNGHADWVYEGLMWKCITNLSNSFCQRFNPRGGRTLSQGNKKKSIMKSISVPNFVQIRLVVSVWKTNKHTSVLRNFRIYKTTRKKISRICRKYLGYT